MYNKKIKRLLYLVLFLLIFFVMFMFKREVQALSVQQNVQLIEDHDIISTLQVKSTGVLKQVVKVKFYDAQTNKYYPVFCVEPNKPGVGTGANSYSATLSSYNRAEVWRALYWGYIGHSYTDYGLETDDDFYYATKSAIHCIVDGSTPTGKYQVPTRVGRGDNISLVDLQRRGQKVLSVTQSIYEKAINNSSSAYQDGEISVEKQSVVSNENNTIIKYVISEKYGRNITSYNVITRDFPSGTSISKSGSTFTITIPNSSNVQNIQGRISIENIGVKTYPMFLADSGNSSVQKYATMISDPVEFTASASIALTTDELEIVKVDKETKIPLEGAEFSIYRDDNLNGKIDSTDTLLKEKVTTDSNGKIKVTGLTSRKYTYKGN